MNENKSPLLKAKGLLAGGKQNFVIILAAVVLFGVFTLINPSFASKDILLVMTKSLVPYAILALVLPSLSPPAVSTCPSVQSVSVPLFWPALCARPAFWLPTALCG